MSNTEQLDWEAAKAHFDTVCEQYAELEGMPGANTTLTLLLVLNPLAHRYRIGERSRELFDAMMEVE